MSIGLYRDEQDCAFVSFGKTIIPVPKWRYEHNDYYKTPFDQLPTKADYEARQRVNVSDIAIAAA